MIESPSMLARNAALVEGLAAAVPLRLLELERMSPGARSQMIQIWAHDAANDVSSRGDALMFGSKKSGGAARVFNSLAKGLAALAHCPGGVTFAGRHWCARLCDCPEGLRRGPVLDDVEPPTARPARPIVNVFLPENDQ